MNTKNRIDLFLDSGAFSAFTQNITIDIQEYIRFIKEHKDLLTVYANLDAIGDPEKTWKNQQIMEKAGLDPLPCFHFGEDWKWLKMYIEKYEYIALGGMVGVRDRAALTAFIDKCFSEYICGKDGMPKVKVHGFGLTSLRLMLRYPWYSVDSTSWVVTGRMGGVYVPRFRAGKYIYDQDSWKIQVSNRSPTMSEAGAHITTMSPVVQKEILRYFESKGFSLGKSRFKTCSDKYELRDNERWNGKAKNGEREVEVIIEPGLCNDYKQRDELNIMYFLDLEKTIQPWPWAFKLKKTGSFGL